LPELCLLGNKNQTRDKSNMVVGKTHALIKYQIHRKTPSYIVWPSKGVGTEHVRRQAARIWEGGGMKNMSLLQMKSG